MDVISIIARLERFPDALESSIRLFSPLDVAWKPSDREWSALEVLAHLADEEESDFRPRLRLAIESPGSPWLPIDPEGWAVERRYNEMAADPVLARFRRERAASVSMLRSLGAVDWNAGWSHPRAGFVSAGDLLVSWAAHDALHLRQLAKLQWKLAVRDGGGFSPHYAGDW